MLYEDAKVERMKEATKLFSEISNSEWFSKSSIILFLNKNDLFRAKLAKVPFRIPGVRNDDFAGPHAHEAGANFEECVEAAQQYVAKQFLDTRKDKNKEVYVHFTEATNTQNVAVVFNACRDMILRNNLIDSGFMQ